MCAIDFGQRIRAWYSAFDLAVARLVPERGHTRRRLASAVHARPDSDRGRRYVGTGGAATRRALGKGSDMMIYIALTALMLGLPVCLYFLLR
jgi:hypothetical protein